MVRALRLRTLRGRAYKPKTESKSSDSVVKFTGNNYNFFISNATFLIICQDRHKYSFEDV